MLCQMFHSMPRTRNLDLPGDLLVRCALGSRRTGQETGVGAQFDIGDAGRHSHQPSKAAMDRPKRRGALRRNKYCLRCQGDRRNVAQLTGTSRLAGVHAQSTAGSSAAIADPHATPPTSTQSEQTDAG